MSRILRLKPASQPQNLRAEPEKLERATYRSTIDMCMGWDFQWDWESNGNPMGMGIKHRVGNENGREWETTSVGMGMGITCTPMRIYSQRFYAAMSLLSY